MTKLAITIEGHTYEVSVDWTPQDGGAFQVRVDGDVLPVTVPDFDLPLDNMEWAIVDDRPYELIFDENLDWIKAYSGIHRLEVRDLEAISTRPRSGDGRIKAPIPGLISRILVQPGQPVVTGDPLLVLEAMKMENEIRATRDGTITAVLVQRGQTVIRNEVLAEIS